MQQIFSLVLKPDHGSCNMMRYCDETRWQCTGFLSTPIHPFATGVFYLLFPFVPFIDGTFLKFSATQYFRSSQGLHTPLPPYWPGLWHPSPTRNAQHNKQHNTRSAIPCHPILPHQSLPMPIQMPILHPMITPSQGECGDSG